MLGREFGSHLQLVRHPSDILVVEHQNTPPTAVSSCWFVGKTSKLGAIALCTSDVGRLVGSLGSFSLSVKSLFLSSESVISLCVYPRSWLFQRPVFSVLPIRCQLTVIIEPIVLTFFLHPRPNIFATVPVITIFRRLWSWFVDALSPGPLLTAIIGSSNSPLYVLQETLLRCWLSPDVQKEFELVLWFGSWVSWQWVTNLSLCWQLYLFWYSWKLWSGGLGLVKVPV